MQPDYKKYFVLLIAIILLPYSLPAQQAVTVDLAYFRGAGNRSRVEVYLGIDRSSLNYKDLRRQKVADLAAVILVQEKGIVTAFREIPIRDIVAEPIGAIICQTDFELSPGHYDVKLAVEDNHRVLADTTFTIEVQPQVFSNISLSSLQVASWIQRYPERDKSAPLELRVVPNPLRAFNPSSPLLWYYVEVYGVTPTDSVKTVTSVWQGDGQILSVASEKSSISSLMLPARGAINLGAIEPGDYNLKFQVITEDDSATALTEFIFVQTADTMAETETVDSLKSRRLTELARGLASVQTDFHLEAYSSNDLNGRREMVKAALHNLPGYTHADTAELTDKMLRRWPQVTGFDEGWKRSGRLSAVGASLWQYGYPEQIEIYPATGDRREYQIWTYHEQPDSGKMVLLDKNGHGAYYRVHSTLPGGRARPHWRQLLPWYARGIIAEETAEPDTAGEQDITVAIDTAATIAIDTAEALIDSVVIDTARADTTAPDVKDKIELLIESPADTTGGPGARTAPETLQSVIDTTRAEESPPDTSLSN